MTILRAHFKRDRLQESATERALANLASRQHRDGAWEGEVVWCAMIAAQMVIARAIVGNLDERSWREGLRIYLARQQNPDGGWGLHPLSSSTLFVTTLCYVALRPLRDFLRDELYGGCYAQIDFARCRTHVAETDLYVAPSRLLRALFLTMAWTGRLSARLGLGRALRARALAHCLRLIRGEVAATAGQSLSPGSGGAHLLALWAGGPADPRNRPMPAAPVAARRGGERGHRSARAAPPARA